jgi:hypothetical protein
MTAILNYKVRAQERDSFPLTATLRIYLSTRRDGIARVIMTTHTRISGHFCGSLQPLIHLRSLHILVLLLMAWHCV